MGRHLSQTGPSTLSRVKRKWGDSIHKEQLRKSEVYFIQNSLWFGPPNPVKVQTVVHGNQGCDLRANGSVCMVSGPVWAFQALLDLAACQPDALCPRTAPLSPIRRKLPGLFNRMETYAVITWSCMLLRPTVAVCMRSNVLDQIRDLAPRICWVVVLGFKARFEGTGVN